jgi:hypothetical protein
MKRVLIKCGWLVTLDPAIGEMKAARFSIAATPLKPPAATSIPPPHSITSYCGPRSIPALANSA